MSKRNWAGFGCLLLGLLLVLSACGKKERVIDWSKRFLANGNEPYDLMVFHELLRERDEGLELLTNNFRRKIVAAEDANYIQIESSIQIDSNKMQHLREFVHRGNNAYFISNTTPYTLFSALYDGYSYPYYRDTSMVTIEVAFESNEPTYPFEHLFDADPAPYGWSRLMVPDTLFSDTAGYPQTLSHFGDSSINFFKISFGKGAFYFHTQPVLFTNLMLKTPSGFEHLQQVFEELNPGNTYWDVSFNYRQPDDSYNSNEYDEADGSNSNNHEPSQALFRLLFSDTALQWGWYALLISVLLFILFRSKRQQRIIPVLPVNRNESLDFARNMGNMYFNSKNHKYIALEMYDIFLADARNRYQIDTNQEPKDIFTLLAKRSGMDQDFMDQLLDHFAMRFSEYSKNEQLIRLYTSLTNYYKSRK